jgi:hypothetical protein
MLVLAIFILTGDPARAIRLVDAVGDIRRHEAFRGRLDSIGVAVYGALHGVEVRQRECDTRASE